MKFRAPLITACVLAVASGGFALWLLAPLNTLLWGNIGDESYVIAGMQAVRDRGWFHDFYYSDLPPFYPPLSFWIFGTLTKPFVGSGIGAAKVATVVLHAACFLAPLFFVTAWRRLRGGLAEKKERWAAVLAPLVLFLMLDYDALLLKPHEVFAAVLAPFWLIAAYEAVSEGPLTKKQAAFLGIAGAALFLLYHLWWFFIIPALFIAVLTAPDILPALRRFAVIGAVTALVASPYLLPLLSVMLTQPTEPWQAFYLSLPELWPFELFTRGPMLILGLGGLAGLWIVRRKKQTVPLAAILDAILLWYVINLMIFFAGGYPMLPSKAFLFLGGSILAVVAASALADRASMLRFRFGNYWPVAGAIALALAIPLLPPFRFLPLPKVVNQLEVDKRPQGAAFMAENIRTHVPDHLERTWLTSGVEDLNGYVSLRHYLAHNQHFSHPASRFSVRMKALQDLTGISDPTAMSAALDRLGIDAAILFKGRDRDGTTFHPLDFYVDDWPNGGKDIEMRLTASAFPPTGWTIAHEDDDWLYLAKDVR